jgi:hypothetical protein
MPKFMRFNFSVRAGNALATYAKPESCTDFDYAVTHSESVGCPAFQKMAIAMLRHPLGASQVAFPGPPRALGLLRRIDLQDDTRNLGPIRTLSLGVEEAQIGNEMVLIVAGKNVGLGDLVGNWGIKRFGHDHYHHCPEGEREPSWQGARQRETSSLARNKTGTPVGVRFGRGFPPAANTHYKG